MVISQHHPLRVSKECDWTSHREAPLNATDHKHRGDCWNAIPHDCPCTHPTSEGHQNFLQIKLTRSQEPELDPQEKDLAGQEESHFKHFGEFKPPNAPRDHWLQQVAISPFRETDCSIADIPTGGWKMNECVMISCNWRPCSGHTLCQKFGSPRDMLLKSSWLGKLQMHSNFVSTNGWILVKISSLKRQCMTGPPKTGLAIMTARILKSSKQRVLVQVQTCLWHEMKAEPGARLQHWQIKDWVRPQLRTAHLALIHL